MGLQVDQRNIAAVFLVVQKAQLCLLASTASYGGPMFYHLPTTMAAVSAGKRDSILSLIKYEEFLPHCHTSNVHPTYMHDHSDFSHHFTNI